MADVLTTTLSGGGGDALLATYFVRKALPRLTTRTVFYQFGEKTPLPKAGGATVTWNAWSNFAPVSNSLTQGTNPSLALVSARRVTATIAQYSRGAKTSDLLEYVSNLDVLGGLAENLGDSAGLSVDKVIQLAIFKNSLVQNGLRGNVTNILSAWMSAVASAFHAGSNGTNSTLAWGFPVVLAGGTALRLSAISKTAPSVSAKAGVYMVKKAVRQLTRKDAIPFADGKFKLVANSDWIDDLVADSAFQEWLKYSGSKPMEENEATVPVARCRIYESNNLSRYRVAAHSCDVSFVFGQGAYGVTEFGNGGNGFEIITKRPNQYDTSNPANMYGTMTYKFNMVAAALNVSCGRTIITHMKP